MTETIIDPKLPSTFYIWDTTFRVLYKFQASRTIEDIRRFGTPTVGNEEVDKEIQDQWVDARLPISTMAEMFSRGVPMQIRNMGDTKTIYDYITHHLTTWKEALTKGLNTPRGPMDELRMLDEFGTAVYEHAKHRMSDSYASSVLVRDMVGKMQFGKNNIFTNSPVVEEQKAKFSGDHISTLAVDKFAGTAHSRERQSLSNFFRQKQVDNHESLNRRK